MIFNIRYLVILTLCFISVWPASAAVFVDRIVAVVEDDIIVMSELQTEVRVVKEQLQRQGQRIPPDANLERQVLDDMIITKLQLQMAERTGIRVDDAMLNTAMERIATENSVNLSRLKEMLEREGLNYEEFRENMRHEIAISQLLQRQVNNRVNVTTKELENFLANEEFRGDEEAEYRLSHILLALSVEATEEQVEQTRSVAKNVLEELRSGKDFAAAAVNISDGQNSTDGGDLGWRKKKDIPSLFSANIARMEKGDISDLIENSGGFHIIKLTGVRKGDRQMVNRTRSRHILIRINELTTDEDAEQRLKQLKSRIAGGSDFGTLARSNSDDTVSAIENGELGWTNPGQMTPEFEKVINSLEVGEVSDPFKTPFGWHIAQVQERKEFDDTSNAKQARAIATIRGRKVKDARQKWLQHLRDETYVEYRFDDK